MKSKDPAQGKKKEKHFYVRTADPVMEWWTGMAKCPHKATVTGLAKDCLPCLRKLVYSRPSKHPNFPVACVVLRFAGAVFHFGASICSLKDAWDKETAYNIAVGRLDKGDKFKGVVNINDARSRGPVKIEIMRRLCADNLVPQHARRAAERWLKNNVKAHP